MATFPTPNDLTRQQLDELDALLQRMLTLPLNKSEPVTIPPAPPLPEVPMPANRPSVSLWRSDSAPVPKSPYIAAEPEPAIVYAPVEMIARNEPMPSGGPGTLRGVDAPATPYGFHRAYDHHDSEAAAATPIPSAFGHLSLADVNPFSEEPMSAPAFVPKPKRTGTPILALPLVACNWCIESTLAWTGPLGAVVRMTAMKHLLGFVGCVLILGAAAWSAKGMGWIKLPK